MTTLLDLPPEIILLIISRLQEPDKPPKWQVRKRPQTTNGKQLLCPCYDDENIMKQVLTQAGKDDDCVRTDVMQLGEADPYLMDCIVQSRCFEMIDVLLSSIGLIAPPPIEKRITSAARTVNVIFWLSLGPPRDMAHDQALSLFPHLKRYPAMDRLILDCTGVTEVQARLLCEAEILQPADVSVEGADENGLPGVRHLRIHLPNQAVSASDRNSNIVSRLSQALNVPNLTKLNIAMKFSNDWLKGAGPRITAFECLKFLAEKWGALEIVKVCVRVGFAKNEILSSTCELWRCALMQAIQTFSDSPACKLELCFVYTWGNGATGVPLDSFQPTSDFGWALKGNLAPFDKESVLHAIREIQSTQTSPVPSFDLSVRYFDSRNPDGASRDLVKIRYRSAECGAPLSHTGHAVVDLDCDFNRPYHQELHRTAWMLRHDGTIPWGHGEINPERLPKLEEDYAKAFPNGGDDSDDTLVR